MSANESSPAQRLPFSKRNVGIGIGILFAATMFCLVLNQWRLHASDRSAPIENFTAALKKHGLTGAARLLANQADTVKIAHETTFEVQVEGQPVWVVYFDPFSPDQVEALKEVKRAGALEVDGQSLDAKVRGAVALVGFKGHPDEDKLLAAFTDFQTPD